MASLVCQTFKEKSNINPTQTQKTGVLQKTFYETSIVTLILKPEKNYKKTIKPIILT